jgi:hypothetical protein
MGKDTLIPIYELKKGDVLLDKDCHPVVVKDIHKTPYQGMVVSVHHHNGHTAHTPLHTTTQETTPAIQGREFLRPDLSYYYRPHTDKETTLHHLNFVLRCLCHWEKEMEHENGWVWCAISHADRILLQHALPCFLPFHYKDHGCRIGFQDEALTHFIDQCLENLLFLAHDKLAYFFSYLDRELPRLTPSQARACNRARSLLGPAHPTKTFPYMGEVYDVELGSGDSFCTTHTIVHKHEKLYLPDHFFQTIPSPAWEEILHSQAQYGRPSLVCVDRNRDECVSGDTRILTLQGVVPISSKKDEIVSVWNGSHFMDVLITRTGDEKRFLQIHFSNGMCLTCTPYHKFFLAGPPTTKAMASDIQCGDRLAPFQLPSLPDRDTLPSSVRMTLEWISKRCVYTETQIVLFDRDMESLRDILLDLQCCGVKSAISHNSFRNEYELRVDKTRWNLLHYHPMDKNTTAPIEGDWVDDLRVVRVEECPTYQGSYCFHEPFSGTALFEGIATGQCENIPDTCSVQAHIDLPRFLVPNPMRQTLWKHKVVVYTTQDCPFSRLLQQEYDHFIWKDIALFPDEWETKRHIHALTSVPALFMDNVYVGDFADFWDHCLCPFFDFDQLRNTLCQVCNALDHVSENRPNRPLFLDMYGLWEVVVRMKLSPDEPRARQFQSLLFRTIYETTLAVSHDLSVQKGPCVNSQKIIAQLEPPQDPLWKDILAHGLRNKIYLRTREEEKPLACRFYECLERDLGGHALAAVHASNSVQGLDIPPSLKTLYRNEYELPQWERFWSMVQQRENHFKNDTFVIYLGGGPTDMGQLSKLEQQAWAAGFRALHVRKQ